MMRGNYRAMRWKAQQDAYGREADAYYGTEPPKAFDLCGRCGHQRRVHGDELTGAKDCGTHVKNHATGKFEQCSCAEFQEKPVDPVELGAGPVRGGTQCLNGIDRQ